MSWFKWFVPTSVVVLGLLLAPCWVVGQPTKEKPKKPPEVARRLPDLTVTSFSVTGPASRTYPFVSGIKPSPGYIFVPVKFTVANIGTATAQPFKIGAKCLLLGKTVRPAGFLDYSGTQDKVGGGGAGFSAKGGDVGATGAPVAVPSPLPVKGKVNVSGTLAVPVGSVRDSVGLWIVADVNNDVRELDESNNESKVINVKVPAAQAISVTVSATPKVITPGQKTRVVARVTRGGKPLAGAQVVFEAGGGLFQSSGKSTSKPALTAADGTCSDQWSYTKKMFAKGYALGARVTFRGETARGEVLVRVVAKIE